MEEKLEAGITASALAPEPAPVSMLELQYVDFEGPDDPLHPWNWSIGKRWFISVLISLSTMTIAGASSIFNVAIPSVMTTFNISREVGTLGVSLYVLGFATGPLIWAPISELRGRYLPFTISLFGFTIFCFATACSGHSLASIFICRYFAGLFGAGPLTLAGAIFSDLFTPKDRSFMINLYGLTVFLGPLLSQPIGGFIVSNPSLDWEWIEFLPGILGGSLFLLLLIFLKESYTPIILAQKADKLRRETGDSSIIAKHETVSLHPRTVVNEYLLLPIRMLIFDPIILCMCIFGAFVYGLLYLFLTAYAAIFEDVHHMKLGVAGLPYLGIVVGQVLNVIVMGLVRKYWMIPRMLKNQGRMEPEWNLPIAIPGAAAFSVSLFWLGWTGYKKSIHWMVPTASGVLSGFGLLAMFLPSIAYVVTARPERSASGAAAHTFLRSLFGASFPLFAPYMYDNLGIQWAGTLLGCATALMIPIPLLLYVYGARIRQRAKINY